MINVGIIGYGKMGKIRHEAIKSVPGVKVVAIYDSNSKLNTNIKVNSSDEIINNKQIDAIYICTPNFLNKLLTIKSLSSGKHVFFVKNLLPLQQKMY